MGNHGEAPEYGFIDMHCHMMPGVDDGSKDPAMSVRMMRVAMEENIQGIILTPHHKGGHRNVDPDRQYDKIDEMVDAAWEAGIDARGGWERRRRGGIDVRGGIPRMGTDLTFYPGNEIMYDSEVPDRLEAGEIHTMAGSSYILVEFRPEDPYSRIQEGLRELSWEGYRVILAHCERYDCLRNNPELPLDLRRNGIYLQVNADSVLTSGTASRLGARSFGIRRNPVTRYVHALLEREAVSFVSTDAHRDEGRAPLMMDCWALLSDLYDPDYVREITRENAILVIRDEEIPLH